MTTTCRVGQVSARQLSEVWFEVRVNSGQSKAICEASSFCQAFSTALSFVLGRRCAIRGYHYFDGSNETLRLNSNSAKTTRDSLLPPIGQQQDFSKNIENLLGLAIDFFSTEIGKKAASFLGVCWDVVDNAHQTRLAVSSTSLEGLLRLAAKIIGPKKPQIAHSDLEAFNNWIETTPDGYSDNFLRRLKGIPGMFCNLGPSDIFRDWISQGTLGVTQEDFDAWKSIRNPSAHGNLGDARNQEELQKRVSQHALIQNLLNKIILQLMGYQGQYIDYSQPGYPPADFPAFPSLA